jgi:hypothetical protein
MVMITVHDSTFFVFFFLALCLYLVFLVCVSSFRFLYFTDEINPLISYLFTVVLFFFFCGPSARFRAMVSPLSGLRDNWVFTG